VRAHEVDGGWALEAPRGLLERAGSGLARLRIVAARTSGEPVSLFVVPLDEPAEHLPPEALLGEPGGGDRILLAVAPDVWLGQAAAAVGARLGARGDEGGTVGSVRDAYLAACRLRDAGRPYRQEAARALDMARDLRI
jgi:hypothetical protein